MRIIYGFEAIEEPLGPAAVTLGTFDGLHVGHRAIVERIVDRARKTGARSVVYSFYPPPWRVLGRGKHPYLILTLQDKIDLLHHMGVDVLVTEEFTPSLQSISHEDFAANVIRDRLSPSEIHVGYDFHFGKDRLGDWRYLADFFAGTETQVRPHGAVRIDGDIVGCTMIREHVVSGRVADAARFLGRFHFVRGIVVKGRGRGRTIGFPTANVAVTTELMPPAGVYAVELKLGSDGRTLPGVANLGFRPTFAEKELALEVHLFDFDEDLYGERVTVSFVERIRDEKRFDGIDALVAQIQADAAQVRSSLPYSPPREGALTWDPKPR